VEWTLPVIRFIDEEGYEIMSAIYTAASKFTEYIAQITNQKENQYEIDTDGKSISQGKRGM
jgi:hypothetical protein